MLDKLERKDKRRGAKGSCHVAHMSSELQHELDCMRIIFLLWARWVETFLLCCRIVGAAAAAAAAC